ncbi:MAG: polysaccharide biosynthesis/export family protein [Brevundimonas sp.]|jgi:polysaccharide export outer membrane protein
MISFMRIVSLLISAVILTGCASNGLGSGPSSFVDPIQLQAAQAAQVDQNARIGSGDSLRISVFRVPELSFDSLHVDAAGNIEMPLIGTLVAEGRTAPELAEVIQTGLAARYLQDPRVTVSVIQSASQKITVDGAVGNPGVYVMQGRTTLLQAIAMAEGASRSANLSRVAVFRTVDNQRMAALFDVTAIRRGEVEDPIVLGQDVVIVDTSRLSAAFQDFLMAAPAFALFRAF